MNCFLSLSWVFEAPPLDALKSVDDESDALLVWSSLRTSLSILLAIF